MKYTLFILSVFPLMLFFLILLMFVSIQQQAFPETVKSIWSIGKSMPTPRTEVTATLVGDNIYVIGGLDKSGKVLDTAEVYNIKNNYWLPSAKLFIYDTKNDTWIEGSSMPTARGALTAVFIDGILYAIGGEGENRIMDINEAYNSKANTWISKSPMPTARHHAASAVVDENVYVIGGR